MLSPAKINLGLQIPYKRKDGYHEIRSLFLRLNWGDEIEIFAEEKNKFFLNSNNLLQGNSREDYDKVSEKGEIEKNILYKVWKEASKRKELPGLRIELKKRIPTGGGLGGGSTNAASVLKFLFPEEISKPSQDFLNFVSRLGADIPFFLKNSHQIVGGIGEKLTDISVASGFGTLVYPGYLINTKFAFQNLKKSLRESPPLESWIYLQKEVRFALERGDWHFLKDYLENEFEAFAMGLYPDLWHLKESMYSLGYLYVSMSGSGSCFYGLHSDIAERDRLQGRLSQIFPEFCFYSFGF